MNTTQTTMLDERAEELRQKLSEDGIECSLNEARDLLIGAFIAKCL